MPSGSKVCTRCGKRKPCLQFNKRRASSDGLQPNCRKCTREKDQWNAARPEVKAQVKRNVAKFFARPENANKRTEYTRKHNQKYPEKTVSRQALLNAVRDGKLIRQPCSVCGKPNADAHHDDYSKPFEVRWFCTKHHREIAHQNKFRKPEPIL